MLAEFSVTPEKNLWLENFLNLKLNTRLPTKRYENWTLMLSERKEKDLSLKFTQLSLAEIVEDQLAAI